MGGSTRSPSSLQAERPEMLGPHIPYEMHDADSGADDGHAALYTKLKS